MSEKIFACLLRLYPSRFREKYTKEAVQLYRDLHRQETGLLRRTSLWIGLLADLVFGLPQAYRNTYVSTTASPVALAVQGVPTFRVLELKPVRLRSFLFGSILTLALMGTFSAVPDHPIVYGAQAASGSSSSPIMAVMERLQSMSSGRDADESRQTDSSVADDGRNGEAGIAKSVMTQPAGVETQKAKERRQVIPPSVERPDLHYPYSHLSKNAGEEVAQTEMRAQPLTRDAREARNSIHIPSRDGTSAVAISPYRGATEQHGCASETVKILPHNIGYFKLDSFPDPEICGASTDEAMVRLNETSAIIFDLRENRGAHTETAEQIAAWLFERPAAWYNPGERSAAPSMTHSPARNSRLGNKPVYILTSSRTVDGAEQFVYNLKILKRATVIGERTRGGTHARPFDRNADHPRVPMNSLANSYGKPDWEGTGIAPDVEVKESDALQIAEKCARAKIEGK